MKREINLPITLVAIVAFLVLTTYTNIAFADVKWAGKLETKIVGTLNSQDEFNSTITEHLNLELLLPDYGDTSGKMEFDIYHQPDNKTIPIAANVSKMYVKHEFENFDLTLGRQPISWSFGSLINPVDYNLSTQLTGMMIPEKSADGVEAYFPIDWKSGISAVASYPQNSDGVKYGIRGRTTQKGYDLTFNYVSQPASTDTLMPESKQLALTTKGDIGPIGVYTAAGYSYQDKVDEGKAIYLVGGDYSFQVTYSSKLILQVEYLRDEAGKIQQEGYGKELILTSLNYDIDQFSGIGLMGVYNPEDGSGILVPRYNNMLGSGLDFNLTGTIFLGDKTSQFGSKKLPQFDLEIPKGRIEAGFGYTF